MYDRVAPFYLTVMTSRLFGIGFALLSVCVPAMADAQTDFDANPGSAVRTRAELEELLDAYQRVLESPAYSNSVKESTRVKAERIRERLEFGDFALGDRIALSVLGEPELPDTVTVQAGPRIVLPPFGDIPLGGVLRSEVEAHLTEALGQYIRDPDVTARALMRLSVQGAVGAPGFYVVPAEMLLSEVIMVAGGPGQGTDLDGIEIERGEEVVLGDEAAREAIRQGMSLDQLNLQAGDEVVVPEDSGGIWGRLGLIGGAVSTAAFILFRLQVF